MSKLSYWLDWKPEERISENLPSSAPTKPTKPGFDGFVGATSANIPEIQPARKAASVSAISSQPNLERGPEGRLSPEEDRRQTTPGPQWPPECLAAQGKFHVPSAKLYPLLNHLVWTPKGKGTLLQVFSDRVTVHLKDEPRTCDFRPEEIAVPDDARQAREPKPC